MFIFMNTEVKSAVRVLDLLELFSVTSEPLSVSDVARRLDWPKSSAQALLLTLTGRGYLTRQDALYQLPAELRGGWVGGLRARLLGLARPVMQRMAQESGESAFIGAMTASGRVQYLDKVPSPQDVRYDASLDHLRPAHCTSIGLVMMAHMPSTRIAAWLTPERLTAVTRHTVTDPQRLQRILADGRRAGYVEVRDANVEGASGVSAAVFGPNGEVVAALNLGAPTARYVARRQQLIDIVCREAAQLTTALGAGSTAAPSRPTSRRSLQPSRKTPA